MPSPTRRSRGASFSGQEDELDSSTIQPSRGQVTKRTPKELEVPTKAYFHPQPKGKL